MAYLVLASGFFVGLGYSHVFDALDYAAEWDHATPRVVFIMTYILALALGLAVGVMLVWQLSLIAAAQSSVENQDFARYQEVAKARGETFVNSYDLGRSKNLALFFNIGPNGYPAYTLFLPVRCMPQSDGWTWARRAGYDKHAGIEAADEFTDEDED